MNLIVHQLLGWDWDETVQINIFRWIHAHTLVLRVCAHASVDPSKLLKTHLFICIVLILLHPLWISFFLAFFCGALFFPRMLGNVQSNLRISFGERHTLKKDSVTMRRFFTPAPSSTGFHISFGLFISQNAIHDVFRIRIRNRIERDTMRHWSSKTINRLTIHGIH